MKRQCGPKGGAGLDIWRRAAGENSRLSEAPGHQFGADEAEHLSTAVEFALELGWDALLAAKPKRQLLLLSHDDRMEIYRGFERRLLAEKADRARILAPLKHPLMTFSECLSPWRGSGPCQRTE